MFSFVTKACDWCLNVIKNIYDAFMVTRKKFLIGYYDFTLDPERPAWQRMTVTLLFNVTGLLIAVIGFIFKLYRLSGVMFMLQCVIWLFIHLFRDEEPLINL